MSDTALDLDLATLVGELPAVPCEHSQHGTGHRNHDNGVAVNYAQGLCPQCGHVTDVYGACAKFSAAAIAGFGSYCIKCLARHDSRESIRILGPIHG